MAEVFNLWASNFSYYFNIIVPIEHYVENSLVSNDASHNWNHVDRVRKIALKLAKKEKGRKSLIEIAALLHDVEDSKYQKGGLAYDTSSKSKESVHDFLIHLFTKPEDFDNLNYNPSSDSLFNKGITANQVVSMIEAIIKAVSFKNELQGDSMREARELGLELEAKIVQDADRLDALGAIGIARTFNYAGRIGRPIYNPEVDRDKTIKEVVDHQKYSNTNSKDDSTINHFYEKLFHLKDMMKTNTGRRMAEKRHVFMLNFVEELKAEWDI